MPRLWGLKLKQNTKNTTEKTSVFHLTRIIVTPRSGKKKGGWPGFLGKKIISFYETWEEASKAAQALGFKTSRGYIKGYKQDLRLPSGPHQTYSDVWKKKGGWPGFLGTK
ncbi:MAG: hypothetical protein GF349_03090 [Candidatus Magasanikbacteria bacterium]|nr:hypothetical protein [Candidatus Magasanikbacteria bacterium]